MTREEIKSAVGEAMEEKLGSFFIERERHFKDHEFITGVRIMGDKIKGHACKVVTNGGITGIGLLLLWGIYRFIEMVSNRVKIS